MASSITILDRETSLHASLNRDFAFLVYCFREIRVLLLNLRIVLHFLLICGVEFADCVHHVSSTYLARDNNNHMLKG